MNELTCTFGYESPLQCSILSIFHLPGTYASSIPSSTGYSRVLAFVLVVLQAYYVTETRCLIGRVCSTALMLGGISLVISSILGLCCWLVLEYPNEHSSFLEAYGIIPVDWNSPFRDPQYVSTCLLHVVHLLIQGLDHGMIHKLLIHRFVHEC